MTDSNSTKKNLPQIAFEGLTNLSALITAITIVISAITFLPNQQKQERNQIQKNQIDTDRSHYEAWNIINNNKVQASSGRITALQNLAKDRVSLNGLEVPGAFLFNIYLGGAELYRANFQGADLYRSDFSSKPQQNNPKQCSWLILNKFADCKSKEELQPRQTELERANFRGTTLYEAKFNAADSSQEKNENLGVDLYRADFSAFYLEEKNKMQNILQIECFMNEPIIKCTRAINTEFIGTNLKQADFTKASLKGANFSNANLECASFRGAIFNKEQEKSKDLTEPIKPTKFTNANLKGTDLRDLATPTKGDQNRGISPEQIKEAKNWETAKYSEPFLTELGLSKQNYKPYNCETFQK
jgi:BTB/POZ domain-containing protein KCTD9